MNSKLHQSEKLHGISNLTIKILSALPYGLLIFDKTQSKIIWINSLAEELLDYDPLTNNQLQYIISNSSVQKSAEEYFSFKSKNRQLLGLISSLANAPIQLITLLDLVKVNAANSKNTQFSSNKLSIIGEKTLYLMHQIRNCLAISQLYTENLRTLPNLNKQGVAWIEQIQTSHANIEKQIKDLLLFIKDETNLKPKLVSIKNWLAHFLEKAEPFLKIYKASLFIDNNIAEKNFFIHEESFTTAILNLLLNALQAKANSINLHVNAYPGKRIKLSFRDNGEGMTEEIKQNAFSPFFTTKTQGSGLGLAIVYSVIKNHQGEVILESQLEQGSNINIILPETSCKMAKI